MSGDALCGPGGIVLPGPQASVWREARFFKEVHVKVVALGPKSPTTTRVVRSLLALAAVSAPAAQAAGKDDMLLPSQVDTTGESSNPANDSAFFVGTRLAFGQARPTEGDSSPGTAFVLGINPGFQFSSGSWNRIEVGVDVLVGSFSASYDESFLGDTTVPLNLGLLAKAGYGYSLGNRMFAVMSAGVGPLVSGKIKAEPGGRSADASGQTGLGAQLSWQAVAPLTDRLDFTGGITWLHAQFNIDDVKDSTGTKYKVDRQLIFNAPLAEAGVRYRF